MPIKPENAARYPRDWPAIRLAACERAQWRCQHAGCRALQYAVGTWGRERPSLSAPWLWYPVEGNRPATTVQDREFWAAGEGLGLDGERWSYGQARAFVDRFWLPTDETRPIVIVLTVAHLDHQPENCEPGNLRLMCQRHHLAYDQDHHRASAQATRRARRAIAELF